jgi:hypothetical protein
LQDRVVSAAEVGSAEELLRVRKEIVDFHGEMVLLENYSALNYTGETHLTRDERVFIFISKKKREGKNNRAALDFKIHSKRTDREQWMLCVNQGWSRSSRSTTRGPAR